MSAEISNPAEYDDDGYARGAVELTEAIGRLWDAGATVANLTDEIESAIENAANRRVRVTVRAV